MQASSPSLLHSRELRITSGGLVAIAAVWPALPFHPSVACPFRAVTGVPCPFCGLTRAVVAAAHGHLASSLAFNPAGIVVLVLAAVAIVRPTLLTRLRTPGWALLTIVGALWLWNIGFNPTFHQFLLR